MKFFVMADIHSYFDAMMEALDKNGFDINNSDHVLVVAGDLFDRGPNAKKVFEFVRELATMKRLIYICGNHEELLFQCLDDIKHGVEIIGTHHESNGTVDTIIQLTGINKFDLWAKTFSYTELMDKLSPVLDFLADNCEDWCEIGDYIIVHGWIPYTPPFGSVGENWREGDWNMARWFNGMQAWHQGARIEGKTIVCGHWNCSWGHSHLHQDRKEFPQKNRVDWQKSFEPFIDEGIVAIDACTAYTGFCNCFVIEV